MGSRGGDGGGRIPLRLEDLRREGQDNGILKMETYDRAQKKWVATLVQTVPGRAIGSSGWTLKRLRFDNFTLVADVTDGEGVDRVLTTKN